MHPTRISVDVIRKIESLSHCVRAGDARRWEDGIHFGGPASVSGRTNEKRSYAGVHLDELRAYERATSNDVWENAHQESALFHLAGAVEAVLHDINDRYSLGLDLRA